MPNFKPKAKKKIKMNKNTLITLDNKHNEKMTRFDQLENTIIPNLKIEKNKLKEQFLKEKDLDKKLEIKDLIKKIKKDIKK